MPTRIRLQRKGKKGQPYYHIVIADGRAPRDGKFIERIGIYNPLTKPAEIELNFDKALDWLQKGAQPTDTVRAIFSYQGVLYKHHLLTGVKKGAMTPEIAETKFQEWLAGKREKIANVVKEQQLNIREAKKQQHEYEAGINEAVANTVAKKQAKEREAKIAGKEAEAVQPAEPIAETIAEPVAEIAIEPAGEPTAETPVPTEESATPDAPAQE